jgi:hypothetical protein
MPNTTAPAVHSHRTGKLLADILTDARRQSREALADIIRDAEWQGIADDDANTAVGNYIAMHILIAGHPHVTVWVQHHTVTVLDTITREILARGELGGGAADLHDLITEGDDEFADLHTGTPAHLGEADHAEALATSRIGDLFTTDDDPEFFDYITVMAESVAA